VTVADGLSNDFATEALLGNVDRGPTPTTPSFTATRASVVIASATAGSGLESVKRSYDDNEETAWSSEGGVANAWIEYRLSASAELIEASFKLTGWRERAYPLRILVDGKEAFRGVASRTLGYVTLPLGNARGQTVRVELIGATEATDAFGISELNEQRNARTGSSRVSAQSLSIVEVEFYTRP
jgi:hypothetical protein